MDNKLKIDRQKLFVDALEALEEDEQMLNHWLEYGADYIHLYISDLDADWDEVWGNKKSAKTELVNQLWVNTSQWLGGIFNDGWQSLESLLTENQLNFAPTLRSQQDILKSQEITASKVINIANYQIALVISCEEVEAEKLAVVIQLHSLTENSFLPANLELMLFDEDDNLVQESVISRQQDNIIQLRRFKVSEETKITIKIRLEDICAIENLILYQNIV